MLAVDMDGTVLGDDRRPVPSAVSALQRAEESGIQIVLASGRTVASLRPFAEQMGLRAAFVGCNGAYVVDHIGEELAHFAVPPPVVQIASDYAQARNLQFNLYSRDEVFDFQDSAWRDLYMARVVNVVPTRIGWDQALTYAATKLLIIDDPELVKLHAENLSTMTMNQFVDQTISEPEYLELLPQNINKSSGLKILANAMKVPQNEVAAIGDFYNDIEMLQWAGVSAAVGNAPEAVQNSAQFVVSANSEGGVAEFVASFVHNL